MNITNKFKTPGVYSIVNTKNGKMYIGSSKVSMRDRLIYHKWSLNRGVNKNCHLQKDWDAFGEKSFICTIVQECPSHKVREIEQWWISRMKGIIYNINPLSEGPPNKSREAVDKRRATMKRRYASGEINSTFSGKTPWNKGVTKENYDYSYLCKPKTITEKVLRARAKSVEEIRSNVRPNVEVYDSGKTLLKTFRSAKDLEEWSLTEENKLPIVSRFKGERMGKPIKYLCSGNILKAAKTGKPYKGLYFKLLNNNE